MKSWPLVERILERNKLNIELSTTTLLMHIGAFQYNFRFSACQKAPWLAWCCSSHGPMQEHLRAHVEQLWSPDWQAEHNAYLQGRSRNTQQYKPGSQEILLLFSARDGGSVFQFPLYEQLKHLIEPILLQVRLNASAMTVKVHTQAVEGRLFRQCQCEATDADSLPTMQGAWWLSFRRTS